MIVRVLSRVIPFLLLAAPAAAQVQVPPPPLEVVPRHLRPAFAVHLGYAAIEDADNVIQVGGSLELGPFRSPRLRFGLGVDYLSSETRLVDLEGSFSDLTIAADIRYRPFGVRTVAPYVGAGVGLHVRNTDYDDPDLRDRYDGLAVGGQLFVGALVDGSASGRWGLLGEVRLARAQDLQRTSIQAGLFMRL